jgi:hypothetical protein
LAHLCGDDGFVVSEEEQKTLRFDQAWCPSFENPYYISGQWSSASPIYMYAAVNPCKFVADDPDSECESYSDSKEYSKNIQLEVFMKNRFFDSSDFGTFPVKDYIMYLYENLLPEAALAKVYKIKKNEIQVQNSWFGFFSDFIYTFFTIEVG